MDHKEQRRALIAALEAKGCTDVSVTMVLTEPPAWLVTARGLSQQHFGGPTAFDDAMAWVRDLGDRKGVLIARHKAMLEEAIRLAEEADMNEGRIAALRLLADGVPA